MLRFSMASASGWAYRGRKLRANVLKVSFNWRRASEAMVSKTMDDLPDPDTPVKRVILRFGMRNDIFFRLFSRAPRIVIYSWDTRYIVLRSPRFTTFEPPEAASWAFQYRTAWRTPR